MNYRRSPCGLFDGKPKKAQSVFVVGRSRMFEDIRRELIMKYSVFNHSDRSNRSDRGFNRRFVGYWSITGRLLGRLLVGVALCGLDNDD